MKHDAADDLIAAILTSRNTLRDVLSPSPGVDPRALVAADTKALQRVLDLITAATK